MQTDRSSVNPVDYSYCKLYVSSSDRSAVMTFLANELGVEPSGYFAVRGSLSFDVLRNPDADGPDDFIFWPTLIEVTNDSGSKDEIVSALSKLLRSAWANGMPIVAACPFERQLPWSGGVQRIRG